MSEGRLSETGRVVRKGGGSLEIVILPADACATCGICCRARDNVMHLEVKDTPSIETGQAVRVTLPYRSSWSATCFVFAVPLALFFAGGAAASAIASAAGLGGPAGVLVAAGGAFAGVGAGLLLARLAERRFKRKVFEEARVEVVE